MQTKGNTGKSSAGIDRFPIPCNRPRFAGPIGNAFPVLLPNDWESASYAMPRMQFENPGRV